MPKRIPLLIALLACLALAGQATAHASERNAAIAGAVVGAVIVANSRYAPAPVYVEVAPPPPRVVYYEPQPVYYQPYPVVIAPYHGHGHKHHHHKHHRHGHPAYYAPRW